MRSFVLEELLLISHAEKRAAKFRFDPRMTVIKGANDTGKSSLLKSIYRCFGAEPYTIHQTWKAARVVTIATFAVDGKRFFMLNNGKRYAVFNAAKKRLKSFGSVTKGVGPYLADLFKFRLKLPSRGNEALTPPPAYLFLPFYIDQDRSWNEQWASFARLDQFAKWKQGLAEFHTGIKPNEYYEARGQYEVLRERLEPLTSRRDILRAVLTDLEEKLKLAAFDIDIESYRSEIRELLVVCDRIQKQEEEIKTTLVSLYNSKTAVEANIVVANAALGELKKDVEFVTTDLAEEQIDCPTCGATYANSFLERFAIAEDEDRCHEVLGQLHEELDGLDKQIAKDNEKYTKTAGDSARVREILAAKQGEVELKDIIESEGRKEVQRIVRRDIQSIEEQMTALDVEISRMTARMDSFTSRERSRVINDEFREFLTNYLRKLSVETVDPSKLKVHSTVNEQGSDKPRALLAYYFSLLQVIRIHSSSTYCPIVIDSPNQQDQDRANIVRMLKFIRDERPENSQIILGLVEEFEVEFPGTTIELTKKHQLLSRDNYEALADEARVFLDVSGEAEE